MLKEFSLKGRNALVTGGGRGIGRAIALTMAEAGANVAVAARTLDQVKSVADEIKSLHMSSIALQADVTNPLSVQEMMSQTISELGSIDILVNNAGISSSPFPVSSSDDAWH